MTDSDGGKTYLIRLREYDRKCLEYMRIRHGTSWAAAIRICIRSAAWNMGYEKPKELNEK